MTTLKQALTSGHTIEMIGDHDCNLRFAKTLGGSKEFMIMMNGRCLHLSKTFPSFEKKLNSLMKTHEMELPNLKELEAVEEEITINFEKLSEKISEETKEEFEELINNPKVAKLIVGLTRKGYKFEFHNREDKATGEVMLGSFLIAVETYEWIWSWWSISLPYNGKGEVFDSFQQSYSMNTGKKNCGMKRGWKVTKELHRQLGYETTGIGGLLEF